ncbi:uncharacterized protein METZ01_LOCUS405966, partial [marine metagenome]
MPALGTVAGGLGTALSGLPLVGGPLSGLLGSTGGAMTLGGIPGRAAGSGLAGMLSGLGGASGLPALTGTLGGGGLFGGGAPAGTTTVGGSSYAPGAAPLPFGYGPSIGSGIMPGSPGPNPGFGGITDMIGRIGQSWPVQTMRGITDLFTAMDPPGQDPVSSAVEKTKAAQDQLNFQLSGGGNQGAV